VKLTTNFLKRFTKRKKNIMTIQQILAAYQSATTALAAYIAGLTPGNTVPANIAAALAAVQAAQAQLNTDATANPFVLATVASDVSNLTTAVANLTAAIASPSNP
jgi:hypothetical protein